MQAVIMVAGKGTRLRPLTLHVPKPMLRIGEKNLVEHNIAQLPEEIDELIFVVGYLKEQIINHFGDNFQGRKVRYIEQEDLLGTGHALKICKDILKERFLVMMGDDLYSKDTIKKCLEHEQCLVAREVQGEYAGGRIITDKEGSLQEILEGQHKEKSGLSNIGLYVINKNFFEYELVKLEGREEYGLPQTIVKMAQDHKVNIEKTDSWIQISDLDDFKAAKILLLSKKEMI